MTVNANLLQLREWLQRPHPRRAVFTTLGGSVTSSGLLYGACPLDAQHALILIYHVPTRALSSTKYLEIITTVPTVLGPIVQSWNGLGTDGISMLVKTTVHQQLLDAFNSQDDPNNITPFREGLATYPVGGAPLDFLR